MTGQVSIVETLLTCIREVSSSNPGGYAYFPEGFHSFSQSLHTHIGAGIAQSVQ